MQFPQCKNQHPPKNRRISTIRLQDLKYSPGNCMRNCKAPSDWRVPEGPDAAPVDGSGTWPGLETAHHRTARQEPLVWRAPEGAAAVPVGGGGAWPGFEATRRAKLAARTARGRAAAHLHTKQPGPTARCDGARNASGATSNTETVRRPSAHRAGRPRGRATVPAAPAGATRRRRNSGRTPREQRRQVHAPAARQLRCLGAA